MLRNPKLSTRWPFRPGPAGRSGLAVSLTAALALAASLASSAAFAHGDVTPQAVDTHELPSLGEAWRPENPYRGNDKAVKIGTSAYNQNCCPLPRPGSDLGRHCTRPAPKMETLDDLACKRIAVPGQSLAGWLLIGSENGKYREQRNTQWKDGAEAAGALLRGEVAAAAGNASELESVLGNDLHFAIEPLPLPHMRDGWAVGCAVKKSSGDLAEAVQQAMATPGSSGEIGRLFAAGRVTWRRP